MVGRIGAAGGLVETPAIDLDQRIGAKHQIVREG